MKCPKDGKRVWSLRACVGCFYLRKVNFGDGDKYVCGHKKEGIRREIKKLKEEVKY